MTMIGSRAYRRSEGNVVAGLEQILVTVARPNPIVLLWRWRYEVALAALIGLPTAALVQAVGAAAAVTLAAAVALTGGIALSLSPALRRFARARAWCVITPHRVRAGCAQARIHSRQGRLPFVLLTSAAPYGERVLLWCRAGTSIEDFRSARPILTAACWAAEIQVTSSRRHSQLVILDVIRGDRPGRPAGQRPPRPAGQRPPRPIELPPAPIEPAPGGDDQPVHAPMIPAPRQPVE